LLYDGHGSTRQLVSGSSPTTIVDSFSYDAYGVMLGGNPTSASPADTNLLYAGEQFDTSLQMYYNRARYYDQNIGRFNRMDPFAGNTHDPQSLHKYLYCHNNPINNIDSTGLFSFSLTGLTISMAIGAVIGGLIGGVVTKSWKGAVYGALIGALIAGAIYTIAAFWPQLVHWFKGKMASWGANRTVSNNLYQRICGFFRTTNPTQAQKLRYFSKLKFLRLVKEGFIGYGQKIWQLLNLNFTGLGTWFTPSLFDGIVGGGIVGVTVLIWIYRDDIKQFFIDMKQPAGP